MNNIVDGTNSIKKKKRNLNLKKFIKLTLHKLSGLVYKNMLILINIENLRLNLVNPSTIAKNVFLLAS